MARIPYDQSRENLVPRRHEHLVCRGLWETLTGHNPAICCFKSHELYFNSLCHCPPTASRRYPTTVELPPLPGALCLCHSPKTKSALDNPQCDPCGAL